MKPSKIKSIKKTPFLMALVSSFIFLGCTIAPITTPKTGRSLGHGNWKIDASTLYGFGVATSRGFNDNWDGGFVAELQGGGLVGGVWSKYAIINGGNRETSLAGFVGIFKGHGFGDAQGAYFGSVVSHKWDWFEPAFSARWNWVHWDTYDTSSNQRDDSYFQPTTWGETDFQYIQLNLGATFWMSKLFGLNVHGLYFVPLSSHVEIKSYSVAPGVNLIWNW